MSEVIIRITAHRGTTDLEFTTVAKSYPEAEADATSFETWLSDMPVRQQLNDRRSLEGAR